MKSRESGFTLIELLVTVAIIGVLAAIAIPTYAGYRERSFDGRSQSDLRNAYTAEEAYFADNNAYTSVQADLESLGFRPSVGVTRIFTLVGTAGWSGDSSHTSGSRRFCFNTTLNQSEITAVPLNTACS
jgi:type IV pilus assembly protein PilA